MVRLTVPLRISEHLNLFAVWIVDNPPAAEALKFESLDGFDFGGFAVEDVRVVRCTGRATNDELGSAVVVLVVNFDENVLETPVVQLDGRDAFEARCRHGSAKKSPIRNAEREMPAKPEQPKRIPQDRQRPKMNKFGEWC